MEQQPRTTQVRIERDEMMRLAQPLVDVLNAQLKAGTEPGKHPLVLCALLAQSLVGIGADIDLDASVRAALPPFAEQYTRQMNLLSALRTATETKQ